MKIQYLFALVVILFLAQSVYALPNSATDVSGRDCRSGHSLSYAYSLTGPKAVKVGDTFTVTLEFKMGGDSQLSKSSRTVSATLTGSTVDISSATQKLVPKASWQVTATKAGAAKMSFATDFAINGADFHSSSYRATYKDTIAFEVAVEQPKPPAKPPVKPPVNNNTPGNNDTQNGGQDPAINDSITENQTTGNPPVDTGNNMQTVTEEFNVVMEPEPDTASWVMTRALGLITYLFLFLSVLIALLKKAKYATWFTLLFKYHHDISLLSLALALFHMLSNLFDSYMWNLSVDKVFVPQFGSLNQYLIALGIIAFYVMLVVVLTSLGSGMIKKMGFKKWKYVHMASYIAFIFVFIHSVLLGTDLKSGGSVAYLFWFSGFIVFLVSADLIIQKLIGAKE